MTNPSNKQSQPIVVVPRIQELRVYTFSFFLCYLHSKCLALDIAELHYRHYEVTESGKLPFKGKKKNMVTQELICLAGLDTTFPP